MRIGPNDPRALRHTGKEWKDDNGFTGPVMVDANGTEVNCFTGSVADFSNGRLDAYLSRSGGLVEEEG